MTRRRIRIDVELPELTPAQADFLWCFLDDLAADLWKAYENELLDPQYERPCLLERDDDSTAEEPDDPLQNGPLRPANDDSDPDF